MRQNHKIVTPPRIRASIKLDTVNPSDYLKYDFRSSCEDCSHFDAPQLQCTLGYPAELHLRSAQLQTYLLSGKMALCRFHEID